MEEQYKVCILCKNCLHTNEMMITKGELRPKEIQCENCLCTTSTETIYSN